MAEPVPPHALPKLEEFGRQCQAGMDQFVRGIEAGPTPPRIFHYASREGLRGILDSGTLWLSDIFRMNDPKELTHGFLYLVEKIERSTSPARGEIGLFAQQLRAFAEQGGPNASAHYFMSSFSGNGDDLSQWCRYADDARGFALGFDTNALEEAFLSRSNRPTFDVMTFWVNYDDAKVRSLEEELAERVLPLLSYPREVGFRAGQAAHYISELLTHVCMYGLGFGVFFKQEGYRQEAEYRFLEVHRADQPPPSVKVRGDPEVRYRELPWGQLAPTALREILVGPAGDEDRAQELLRQCEQKWGVEDVTIRRSNTAYKPKPRDPKSM